MVSHLEKIGSVARSQDVLATHVTSSFFGAFLREIPPHNTPGASSSSWRSGANPRGPRPSCHLFHVSCG